METNDQAPRGHTRIPATLADAQEGETVMLYETASGDPIDDYYGTVTRHLGAVTLVRDMDGAEWNYSETAPVDRFIGRV